MKDMAFLFDHYRWLLKVICFAVFFIILVVGLWPFNFFPQNKVKWLSDRSGIKIYGQGIIMSKNPGWHQAKPLFPDGAITIELWLRPNQETGSLPSILTFYDGLNPDIFLIGQWKSHLVIRSRTVNRHHRKPGKVYQEIGLRNALLKNKDVFITVTSNKNGTFIFLNGQFAKKYPYQRLMENVSWEDMRLIVGNSPTGQSYWHGDIFGMAIYGRAFTADEITGNYLSWIHNDPYSIKKEKSLVGLYMFYEREGKLIHNVVNPDDTLTIPDVFKPIRKVVLSYPWRDDFKWNMTVKQDGPVNILGFIPLGFFFCLLLISKKKQQRSAAYMMTILIGIGISLIVELTQVYLPTRDSSLIDLANNTLGTIFGVLIVAILSAFEKRQTLNIDIPAGPSLR
ncbi:MAG: VanZ family protein [Deltaproteobacteria bacterium]|nr:VanZ family protein [Deltaproteobacteria bacterium]